MMAVKKTAGKTKLLPAPDVSVVQKVEPLPLGMVDPQELILSAVRGGASIEVLERLMDLRRALKAEVAEVAFREAMSRFQAECPIIPKTKIVKNKDGKSTRYKYAPMEKIVEMVQPYLSKNGLSYEVKTEILREPVKSVSVTVKAYHEMGHSSETCFQVPIDPEAFMNEPQKWASAQTFAKRYAFCNAFGILTGDEDDDSMATEMVETDTEKEKKRQEALAKLNALPEGVKTGFQILGYKELAQYSFCQRFEWDTMKILAEIRKIVDMNEKVKK